VKFLIVVPNLNYGKFLHKCLLSLESQTIDIDVVIIDGGSTDDSIDIAKKFCENNTNWMLISRPNLSQAASIKFVFDNFVTNSHDVLGWLNSDDFLLKTRSLEKVVEIFETISDCEVVTLGGVYVDENGVHLKNINYTYHPWLQGDMFRRGGAFIQPSTFWSAKMEGSKNININLRYTFDAELFLKFRNEKCQFYIDQNEFIAAYRLHGQNLSLNIPSRRILELSSLYRSQLERPYASLYLKLVYNFFLVFDKLGVVGRYIKKIFRIFNNLASYLTVYLIPSI
jgi:glycosyltransferase involved in cell wall biosynthesis